VKEINGILNKYWGYESFRPFQEEIITSVLEKKDTLAVLPTGGGKSICFQVPSFARDG
jgi:ATP-dependent DNA helicase RecQ